MITGIEALIRREPANAEHRWLLFQWLCVTRAWDRAIRQLQAFAQLDASQQAVVQSCRDLIRAERVREHVLAGLREPGFVYDDVPAWMRGLLDALAKAHAGDPEGADRARAAALDDAPSVAGQAAAYRFDWIADSDSRLGPVCEVVTAGRYRWLSMADIRAWQITAPSAPLDLVWAACTLTLADGATLRGFMPARYPARFSASRSTAATRRAARNTAVEVEAGVILSEPDEILLGQRTVWHESGRTGVVGTGRKTWMTGAGDFGLFELASATLDLAAGKDNAGGESHPQCTAARMATTAGPQ